MREGRKEGRTGVSEAPSQYVLIVIVIVIDVINGLYMCVCCVLCSPGEEERERERDSRQQQTNEGRRCCGALMLLLDLT